MTRSSLRSAILVCLIVAALAPLASAQGVANSSLSGTIVDSSGAVLPGAAIVAKNIATSVEFQGVSNEKGEFNIPAMSAAYRDSNNTQDPGGRLVQFVLRFNW